MTSEKSANAAENLLGKYARKSDGIAFNCDPIDEFAARRYGERLMRWLGCDYHATVIRDGPFDACSAIHMLAMLEARMGDGIARLSWDRIEKRLDEEIETPVYRRFLEEKSNKPSEDARNWFSGGAWDIQMQALRWIRDQCENIIWKQIKNQIWEQMKERAWDHITEQDNTVFPYLCGQWLTRYVMWHRYHRNELGYDLPDIWQYEEQLEFGGVFPLSCFVVVLRRPERILRNSQGFLHCDNGPALRYADGFSLYALNGERVPEWLVIKNAAELDPREFAKIENPKVRREFVRKVGIERIAQAHETMTLDKQSEYELILIDLGGNTGKWPYLKIFDPSTDIWRLEVVDKEIITVEQALQWRNQSEVYFEHHIYRGEQIRQIDPFTNETRYAMDWDGCD